MQQLDKTECLAIKNDLLTDALYIPSINFNSRPPEVVIDLLVIHCASLPRGHYNNDNLELLFSGRVSNEQLITLGLGADFRVSTHLYINRIGEIYQFVPFNMRAWHAGVSVYKDRSGCNDFSIGIELQGTDDTEFTSVQYHRLITATRAIMSKYSEITKDKIVAHSTIAPQRKTDPGIKFDWQYYLQALR